MKVETAPSWRHATRCTDALVANTRSDGRAPRATGLPSDTLRSIRRKKLLYSIHAYCYTNIIVRSGDVARCRTRLHAEISQALLSRDTRHLS